MKKAKSKTQTVQVIEIPRSWWNRVKRMSEDKGYATVREYFIHVFHEKLMEHDPEYREQCLRAKDVNNDIPNS